LPKFTAFCCETDSIAFVLPPLLLILVAATVAPVAIKGERNAESIVSAVNKGAGKIVEPVFFCRTRYADADMLGNLLGSLFRRNGVKVKVAVLGFIIPVLESRWLTPTIARLASLGSKTSIAP